MADLTETSTWTPGVFRLETSTPALAGPGGPLNQQAQALANRTTWLKAEVEARLPLAGGTLTGPLTLAGDGASPLAAASRRQAEQVRGHNRIINGRLTVAQRGLVDTGIAIPNNIGAWIPTADRWSAARLNGCAFTVQRLTDVSVGVNLLRATVTTAGALGASDYAVPFAQLIEGINIFDLKWGFPGAEPVTLSFWFWSNVAGTYGAGLRNATQSHTYVSSFTVAANTWTQVAITIPGPTVGTWHIGFNAGVEVFIAQVQGASTASLNAWNATGLIGHSTFTPWNATAGAMVNIAEVQLERGTVATPIENMPFSRQLLDCQRYGLLIPEFVILVHPPGGGAYNSSVSQVLFPTVMRVAPTVLKTAIHAGTWDGAIWSARRQSLTGHMDSAAPGGNWCSYELWLNAEL